jgi:TetR/AcrR family transcriptional regulator, transcriptional repressor for nem operon
MVTASANPDARARLLDAGMRLIRERGYDATRVDDLCAAAGTTKGAFFHHFASKADYGAAAAQHWTDITAPMFAAADYHALPDPLSRILGYLDLRRALIAGAPAEFSCVAGTMAQTVFDTVPGIRDACGASIADHAATLEPDFAALIAGAGRSDLDARGLALHTQAVIQGAYVLAKALDDSQAATASIDHLRHYVELLFKPREDDDDEAPGKPHLV